MSLPGTGDDKEPNPEHFERWLPPDKNFLEDWLARSSEIVDKFHPEFIYFDWWDGQPAFEPYLQTFAAYYYNRSAQHGEHPVLTYKLEAMPANAATLDIERGKMDSLRLLPWQTDTSVSIHSGGYVEHDEYRTAQSLIQQLVDTVSKNGNLLLNVGPKADGTIPEEAADVLLQIGEWLRINGEAIYNTRPFSVFGEGPTIAGKSSQTMNSDIQTFSGEDIRFTIPKSEAPQSPNTLYAMALGYPKDGDLAIHILYAGSPYFPKKICSVDLVGGVSNIPFQQQPEGLHIVLTGATPNQPAYVVRIKTCS
jgi:alpha-L-fucosidase